MTLGEAAGHTEQPQPYPQMLPLPLPFLRRKTFWLFWGPEHFNGLWGTKVINFSKWRLRHSLLKANSFKTGCSVGFWRPASLSLGIVSAKKSSFPSAAISWFQSLPFSSGHKSLFQDPKCAEGFISSGHAVTGKTGALLVGPHLRRSSYQRTWFWAPWRVMKHHLPLEGTVCTGYPGRVLVHRTLPFQLSSFSKYVVTILIFLPLHVCSLI